MRALQRELRREAAMGRSLLLQKEMLVDGLWWGGVHLAEIVQKMPAWGIVQLESCRKLEGYNRRFNAICRPALRKLMMLDAAVALMDLRVPPGNRLETLHGDRHGQHSIRINSQWRICFRWNGGHPIDVEITDYQ